MPNELPPKLPYTSAFISHAGEDKHLASDLVTRLEGCGCKCWISKRNIAPGTQWDREIMQGLRNSEVLILLLTDASNASEYVEREVKLAFGMKKLVVPIRFGSVEPSDTLSFWLAAQQLVEATPDSNGLDAVMETLCGGNPPSPAAPLPPSPRKRAWPVIVGGILAMSWAVFFLFTKGDETHHTQQNELPVQKHAPWSIENPKLELLGSDGQPLMNRVIQARRIPASSQTWGAGFEFDHQPRVLVDETIRGPGSLHFYLLDACFAFLENSTPTNGRSGGVRGIIVERPNDHAKLSKVLDAEYVDSFAPDYLGKDKDGKFYEFLKSGGATLATTQIFVGPGGSISAGNHDVGVEIRRDTQSGEEILYRAKFILNIPAE